MWLHKIDKDLKMYVMVVGGRVERRSYEIAVPVGADGLDEEQITGSAETSSSMVAAHQDDHC